MKNKNLFCIIFFLLVFNNLRVFAEGEKIVYPYYSEEKCPVEGCRLGKWTALEELVVYAASDFKKKAGFKIRKDESFDAADSQVVIERPAILEVVEAFDEFKVRDKLELICYTGDGLYKAVFKNQVILLPINFPDDNKKFKILRKWSMVWQVKISNSKGQDGWIRFKNTSQFRFISKERVLGRDHWCGLSGS